MVGAEPIPMPEQRQTGEPEVPRDTLPVKLTPGNWIAFAVLLTILVGAWWGLSLTVFATKTEVQTVSEKANASHTLATRNKADIDKNEGKIDKQQIQLNRIDRNVAIIGGRRTGIESPPDFNRRDP